MSNIVAARKALIARILDGQAQSSPEQRRAAFANAGLQGPLAALVTKVASAAHKLTDDDVAQARAAGFSEDQLFELMVCAAVGQATRQHDAALAALAAAVKGANDAA